jgi:hypothetical protein
MKNKIEKYLVPKLCLMFNRYEYKDEFVLFIDTPSGAWQ